MLTTVAEIVTPTTCVEVLEGAWPKPVELTWNDPRPVVTLLFRPSAYVIEGSYRGEGLRRRFDRIGQIFFIPPNVELLGRGTGGGIKAARCVFDPGFYERTIGGPQGLTAVQLRRCLDVRGSLLAGMLHRLMDEALFPGFAGGALAECLGGAILIEWARQVLHARDEAPPRRTGLTPRQRRLVEDRIEAAECGLPSVSALAALCGLGERHFCRRFREETGESVGRYLQSAQLRRARLLLLESDLPLKEIAFRLGFANPANFSASFRAAMNQPPGAFRRQHKGAGVGRLGVRLQKI